MGTRALIKPLDIYGKPICTIYTQYDGYPDGVPLGVAKYLADRKLVNGIRSGEHFKVVNGMDDLTAQIIAFLKINHTEIMSRYEKGDGLAAGTIYVMPPDTKDVDEEYIYYIYPDPEYSELMKKLDEVTTKLWKLIEQGKDNTEEANELRKTLNEIHRRFFDGKWDIYIKATRPDGKVLFDGTVQEYVKKYSQNEPKVSEGT